MTPKLLVSPEKYLKIASNKLVPINPEIARQIYGKKCKIIYKDSAVGTEEELSMERYLYAVIDNFAYWTESL